MADKIIADGLLVCWRCAAIIANGEVTDGSEDNGASVAAAQVEQWGEHAIGLVLACGSESDWGDPWRKRCDATFSTSACDGCGSTDAGERHPAVVFGK